MSEVGRWLEQLGLGKYAEAFDVNDISFQAMPALTDDDLKELGMSLGHRRILQGAIASLSDPPPTTGSPRAGNIGASMSESGSAERRQLTVMFCDLVGSTELSQRLDPEVLGDITHAFQNECTDAVRRFGGYVARYMGDGLLAYFGYPQAYEDAAERAVRAGLGILESTSNLNRRPAVADTGSDLSVRVGIATGPVVVGELIGDGAARENVVVGATPNLAARLQGVASPGTVVIAPETRQLAGDLFHYRDGGEHVLKGLQEPVRVWQVVAEASIKSRFDAMRTASLTPLVGREQELALLLDRWDQAAEGDGQVVLLSGEPGIGKSRITEALRERVSHRHAIRLRYQCSPYHMNSALHPIIAQLERAAGFDPRDPAEVKLDKLESLLGRSSRNVEAVAPLFASLLSLPAARYQPLALTPERQREKTLSALVEQLEGLCERSPVLFVFEDAHWSDPTSLDLLHAIIEAAQSLRVLVVVTYRTEFVPPWVGHSHITALTLNRFSRTRMAAMMDEITSGKPLPDDVRDQVIDKTDGVPLFVEELTKAILESGLVEEKKDRYVLAGSLPSLMIPGTLQDSLMARLDRLGEARETAQLAAVIGREFRYDLLAKVSTQTDAQLAAALAQLAEAALVFARGTPPDASYVFKHALVQETAYESLLKSRRRQLHGRVAEALAESEDVQPELLAHHLSEAGRYESAVSYWLKAGRRALERSANVEAVAHLRHGLQQLPRLPESDAVKLRELELQLALGPALMSIKGWAAPEIEPVYARARELCRIVGGPQQKFAATWGSWLCYQQRGQLKKARELSDEVLEVAGRQSDPAFMLQAHHAAWATFHRLGEFETCRRHAEEGALLYDVDSHADHAHVYGGHDPGVCAQIHLSMALWCLGYPDQAKERVLKGLRMSEGLSHPFSHVDALFGVARMHLVRQEFEAACARTREMIALSEEHGFPLPAAWGAIIQGFACAAGRPAKDGIEGMQRGLATLLDTGSRAHVPYLLSLLIDAHLRAGRVGEGLTSVADALETMERTGERNWEAEIHRLKGELLLAGPVEDRTEAERCFDRAREIAREQGARSLELRASVSLAASCRGRARREEVRDLVGTVYDGFTEGFDTADLREARALLDRTP